MREPPALISSSLMARTQTAVGSGRGLVLWRPDMPDQPRDPATEVHRVADPSHTRVASYLANRDEVSRVLLLYSGGLDTSVMLKWIQDEYDAEVVALTVNLGQPDEDWDVIRGKALDIGAVDCMLVDAREEFANDYVVPAIKANADYGD